MTIITKPIIGHKPDKLSDPLVENEQIPAGKDIEANGIPVPPLPTAKLFFFRNQKPRILSTIFLLLTALLVTTIGIIGGIIIYRQYAQMNHFKKSIIYHDSLNGAYEVISSREDLNFVNGMNPLPPDHLQEDFDLDVADGNYEKITVPNFKSGPSTRYIHDFNANLTAIVDGYQQTCYIMPLNTTQILKPKDLMDALLHMLAGDYTFKPAKVRENWRVASAPLDNSYLAARSELLSSVCAPFHTYKLEKIVHGVFKRSASAKEYVEVIGNYELNMVVH